jgi:arylformamidase
MDIQEHIGAKELEGADLSPGLRRVLFKTRNGRLWDAPDFRQNFTAIAPDGAHWLAQRGFILVGVDYLSVEPFGAPQPETHRILLRAGIIAVEGLDLRSVRPGEYTLVCLPLKIEGGDGAPARALLIEPPLPQLD